MSRSAVALVVPPLIPDVGHFNLAKGGGVSQSAVLHYHLIAKLSGSAARDDRPAAVHLPPRRRRRRHYLRMAVSDTYNSKGFAEPSPVADPVDPTTDQLTPDGVGSATGTGTLTTQIVIGAHLDSPCCRCRSATTKLDGLQGQWAYQETTEMVFSQQPRTRPRTRASRATSEVISPTPQALENSSLGRQTRSSAAADLVAPSDLPPISLPRRWR